MTSATPPAPGTTLPAAVRRGYGLGSVATGSFGTVPGLLLLPYLTDRLGVPAAAAGVIVFAPKAWDVVLNPIAGRISDRSTHPDGRRRPFLIRAGLLLAAAFALLFLGPTAPQWLAAGWVAVAYLACATAYSFFQVPYVAMPAEITDDYDERTRLMTWRVAILALAILVSGGASPAIRDAFGPVWGYRVVGFFVAALIALGAYGAWRGTRSAPVRAGVATSATFGDQLRIIRSDRPFRLLLTTFVLQALATGAMLAGVDYVVPLGHRDPALGDVALRLLRRPRARRHAAVAALRHGPRQEGRLPRRVPPPRRWRARPRARAFTARRVSSTPASPSSASATPGRRCSRSRCSPTSRAARTRRARASGSTRACGPPERRWASHSDRPRMPPCWLSAATCPRRDRPCHSRTRP